MSKTDFNAATTSEEVVDLYSSQVKGRTFVVTGPGAQSVGGHTALALARAGAAHIVLVSRNPKTVQPVIDGIEAVTADPRPRATFVQCDLSDQDSVRAAAARVLAAAPAIDVLINNAGIMAVQEYTVDKRGIEIQLSANHVGHFLLTNLLAPALLTASSRASREGGARVVNLTSTGHRIGPFRFADWNFSGGAAYDPYSAYAQSKTANILFSAGLTARLRARGVTSAAAHPGAIRETGLGVHIGSRPDYEKIQEVAVRDTGRPFPTDEINYKTLSQGAATTLVAALDPAIPDKSPAYMVNCQIGEAYEYAVDPENAEKLWKLSEEWVGQKFEY